MKECFDVLNENPDCRVIVLSGSGKHFTAGLDLKDAIKAGQQMADIDDPARKGHFIEKRLRQYQVGLIYSIFKGEKVIFHTKKLIFNEINEI